MSWVTLVQPSYSTAAIGAGARVALHRVARQLGYGPESVRSWVRQADIDDGRTPGVSTTDAGRIAELE